MNPSKRIFVIGATGTIGRATVQALVRQGHDVVCFIRARAEKKISSQAEVLFEGASIRYGDIRDSHSIREQGFKNEKFDVLVSCLASRSNYRCHHESVRSFRDSARALLALLAGLFALPWLRVAQPKVTPKVPRTMPHAI